MLIEREPLDVVTVASEAAGEGPRAQLSVREKGDDIKVPSINSYCLDTPTAHVPASDE